ncbi:MAG: bifunctional riboflavin kinase/FAD synthetase [Clostridia bacterium]|nr:bifunctional riboflavin kinase/FAD synthetase [Clostridia bacterium]
MQIFYLKNEKNLRELKGRFPHTAVALGGFDAMHIGHQAIIQRVVDTAKQEGLTSVVYFFSNQPREVLFGEKTPHVNSLEKRVEILEALGVEIAIAQTITPEFLQVSPEEFVKEYLKEILDARFVAAGFNYRFGRSGKGDIRLLRGLGEPLAIQVCEVPCVMTDGEAVSSTRIRTLISSGKMEEAKACLGRAFELSGKVVKGNQFGRELGIPTANLEFPEGLLLPGFGVYLTETKVDGVWYPSMTNVGEKPTVAQNHSGIESHLLAFSGDLYGKEIAVRFHKKMREIIRFDALEELKRQLADDRQTAQAYFAI